MGRVRLLFRLKHFDRVRFGTIIKAEPAADATRTNIMGGMNAPAIQTFFELEHLFRASRDAPTTPLAAILIDDRQWRGRIMTLRLICHREMTIIRVADSQGSAGSTMIVRGSDHSLTPSAVARILAT